MKKQARVYSRAGGRSAALLPTLAMTAAVVFWGMSFVSTRVVLDAGFPPMSMVFVRFAVASLVLLPIHRRLEAPARLRGRRELAVLLLSGLFGVTLYFFFETRGIKLTSASNAALIVATVPVLTVAVDRLLFRHPLSWLQGIGIGLSVLGIILIVRRSSDRFPEALRGNLFMLGACVSWVVYIFLSRRLRGRAGGLYLTTWQSVIGVAFLVPLVLMERPQWSLVPGGAAALLASPTVWLNLLYLGIACSAVSYFLYLYALSALGSVVVSSYINLVPVVGAVGGVAVLGESLSLFQVVGAAVVIAGVFLVNLPRPPRQAPGGPSAGRAPHGPQPGSPQPNGPQPGSPQPNAS